VCHLRQRIGWGEGREGKGREGKGRREERRFGQVQVRLGHTLGAHAYSVDECSGAWLLLKNLGFCIFYFFIVFLFVLYCIARHEIVFDIHGTVPYCAVLYK